jgi:hypothetical protein
MAGTELAKQMEGTSLCIFFKGDRYTIFFFFFTGNFFFFFFFFFSELGGTSSPSVPA